MYKKISIYVYYIACCDPWSSVMRDRGKIMRCERCDIIICAWRERKQKQTMSILLEYSVTLCLLWFPGSPSLRVRAGCTGFLSVTIDHGTEKWPMSQFRWRIGVSRTAFSFPILTHPLTIHWNRSQRKRVDRDCLRRLALGRGGNVPGSGRGWWGFLLWWWGFLLWWWRPLA